MKQLPAWVKKLPKKIVICGRIYKVLYNMKTGACGNLETQQLDIGCDRSRELTMEYLVHEISEIVHVEMGHSFGAGREMRFVMDHAGFQNHCMILVAILADCGLLK